MCLKANGIEYKKDWNHHFSSLFETYSVMSYSLCSCNPLNYSLSNASVHGIVQARILEWVAISSPRGSYQPRNQTHVSCISCIGRQILYQQWVSKWKLLGCVRLFAAPWTVAHQATVGLSRQEYWSGLPFPSPGDITKPGIEPSSPVFSSFSFASFWSLRYWGLWELCICVIPASTIPLHFNLGWIWRAKTGKHFRRPETLTEK